MNKKQTSHGTRSISWFLLLVFTWSTFQPALTYAGGPTQPEASAFTPIGVSDMVDPFTGDFTYNIPLMEIEGYPINIAYNSGVTMDQEASWVGLGWNLNAGAITRALRGIPDDFNGDKVEKTLSTKPNFNINIDAGLTAEIAGFNLSSVGGSGGGGLSVGVGLGFNNYTGYNSSVSIGPSFDFGKFLGGNLTAGFSLSGSSENGASFAPNVSLSYKEKVSEAQDIKRTGTIGTAFNSRAGLQQVSYGFSVSKINYNTLAKAIKFNALGMNIDLPAGMRTTPAGSTSASAGGAFSFGLAEYMPTPQHSKFAASASFKMNVSGSLFAFDGQGNIGVSLSRSWIPDGNKVMQVPSFGYMFSESGQTSTSNQLDFNRDNDQPFSKYSVNLPSAFQTYDIFSVQAQGTGGSFRASRNDVGYVFDPVSTTWDIGADVGLELGFGNLTDIGVDIEIPITNVTNGPWTSNNAATSGLAFRGSGLGRIVPGFGMIEASESSVSRDDLMTSQFYGAEPERLVLAGSAMMPRLNNSLNQAGTIKGISRNQRNVRDYSNNQLYFLSRGEVEAGMGVIPYDNTLLYSGAKPYHIGEITQLGQDGRRYVFALPAYNQFQEDVTFATGNGLYNNSGIDYLNDQSGLLNGISSNDASLSNDRGIDHYYSATKTPAYAHSFMLSAVLSDDYVDSDATPGPSQNDLGSYVKFSYKSVKNFEWRNPIQANTAYYNEGMRSDKTDDKASFVYGKKDLHYVEKIETKNYIAIFTFEARKDGRSANGRYGGINASDAQSMVLLRKITLYSKPDYNAHISNLAQATPIQEVTLNYDYSLCRKYPGNNENTSSDLTKGGKLTLKEIQFTYQNSKKMKYRSYKFSYGNAGTRSNPDYHIKGSDRWGTYKEPISSSMSESSMATPLNNSDYPYAEQDPTKANENANAWNLVKIDLPSGGQINVTYESDDYGFVQHKKAGQMFQIVGIYYSNGSSTSVMSGTNAAYGSLVSGSDKNGGLLFNLVNQTDDISKYGRKGQQLYFRVLSELDPSGGSFKSQTEFVSGYGIIQEITTVTISGTKYGLVRLEPEKMKDSDFTEEYSPIIKQAVLFGRAQLSRTINNNFTPSDEAGGSEQAVMSFVNATINMLSSFQELVTGPNMAVYNQGKGKRIVMNRSWMRLECPSGRKMGGGSRVKEIRIKDNWNLMDGGTASEYGQTFKYVLEDGVTSSGVASYEPQLGGDESPWHTAYIVNKKRRLAMDDKMYIDDPIMESQFPTPSVGYSRVVIEDLKYTGVTRTATGKVVKEFYTAKDFPTIVKRTNVDMLTDHSLLPLLPKYQYLTANQGFSIESNNMHGKQKKESIYGEGQTSPLSEVEYFYKSTPLNLDGVVNQRLSNTIQVINDQGQLSNATVGVRYDAVADFRESSTRTIVPKIHINTNSFILAMLVIAIPPVYPGYDQTTNRFRSATMNKAVERFAILEKTVANQDGSIVETNNLAYDANTGEVLVTQTTTNFNDKVYSLNYPAYWNYPSFGQASKNILYSYKAATVTNNGFAAIPGQYNYFAEGDEVAVTIGSTIKKGWVVDVNTSGIRIVDKTGAPFSGNNATIKVIRSGYKNKQTTSMASMTSFSNPVNGIGTNQFTNVLNAGAVEFGQDWRTYCDCFGGTSNPYVQGIKGNWRPIKSYTYLTDRIQSNYDGNTNIRKDGVFRAFAPFYRLGNGKWEKNGQNWTFVSEVTEFSPNGMTLETRDALGRYSSSQFGYNNTLTTAVSANSKAQQMSAGSFEDLGYTNCMDQNFFSRASVNGGSISSIPASSISTTNSHTGKNSIKVTSTAPVSFQNILSTCTTKPSCGLSLTCSTKACTIMNVSGGVAPYTMEYEAVGNASAEQTGPASFSVSIATAVNTSLTIIVTDSKGCKVGIRIIRAESGLESETIQF
ncbi:hypothetical protein [Fluviicola sp.]|uniref:hypothetical protein n=1 Tax=Fluviicola sp. TaxID=1917219 RepID=UPI0031CEC91D